MNESRRTSRKDLGQAAGAQVPVSVSASNGREGSASAGPSPAPSWKPGFGGARWLCGLGLHPAPKDRRDTLCPACGKEIAR